LLIGCGSKNAPASHTGAAGGGGHGGINLGTSGDAGQSGGDPGQAGGDASGGGNVGTGATVGSGGSAGAGTGGMATTGGIDPNFAGWPMPNNPVDVANGAPNPMAYADNGDGTVTDTVTGLVWQQPPPATQYDWPGAKTYCSSLGLAARNWRLPTAIELVSLMDDSVPFPGPTINLAAFPGTPASSYFWSSTSVAFSPTDVRGGEFGGAIIDAYGSTASMSVRCVAARSNVDPGAGTTAGRYTVAGGTVYDAGTKLTWQQAVAPTQYLWRAAMTYCSSLATTLGGTGWRLPTRKELLTLVDYSLAPPGPIIDATTFPGTPADYFWTESLQPGADVQSAWQVTFENGYPIPMITSNEGYVRCVR
jgi:hypothetical protein